MVPVFEFFHRLRGYKLLAFDFCDRMDSKLSSGFLEIGRFDLRPWDVFDMKIAMIAPEPIFEPRGTPLSIVGRLKALSGMGHRIDLLTYSMGEDVVFPGVRIFRIPQILGIRKIKIGPSFKKIPLDIVLLIQTVIQLWRERYDVIHTHEEAGFWGTFLSRIFSIPHLYDMHSSLPQQLKNFQFSNSRILFEIFQNMEKWVLKYADAVITICPDLHSHVKTLFPSKGSVLVENVVDYGMIFGERDSSAEIHKKLNLKGKTVVLYTGTFESYQGLDLLIDSAESVLCEVKRVVFLLVGGHADQVAHYKSKVEKRGLENHFLFTGQVAPEEVNSYIRCADVLVSPRVSGTNTPLKIYAYLRSGLPIVATRLLTHTQVLDDNVAILTDPKAGSFAEGIVSAIRDRNLARRIGKRALELADKKYGYPAYLEKLEEALERAVGSRA